MSNSSSAQNIEAMVPKPPRQVPDNFKTLQISSATVWLENKLEDVSVANGKALRLSCQVHARQPCGK